MFCPVPQMVGGGTVHWQGWLPRFTPNDFRLRTIAGEVKGATLADWPISYEELEPYYAKVEWAFGVSGQAGANKFEGPRSVGYPCPPLPVSRYAEKFNKVATRSAGMRSRRLRRPCRAPSTVENPRLSAPLRSNMAIPPALDPARSTSLCRTRSRPASMIFAPNAMCANSRWIETAPLCLRSTRTSMAISSNKRRMFSSWLAARWNWRGCSCFQIGALSQWAGQRQ